MRLREQMYRLVKTYEENGQSQQEFCDQQGIGLAGAIDGTIRIETLINLLRHYDPTY